MTYDAVCSVTYGQLGSRSTAILIQARVAGWPWARCGPSRFALHSAHKLWRSSTPQCNTSGRKWVSSSAFGEGPGPTRSEQPPCGTSATGSKLAIPLRRVDPDDCLQQLAPLRVTDWVGCRPG